MPIGSIGLRVNVYARGAGGVPATTQFLGDLASWAAEYEHTISATFGFESMRCSMPATLDAAIWWVQQLMASCVVASPDAETVWEGYLTSVEARIGQETRSISLDSMANRVRVRYTTVLGTPGTTSQVNSTTSQALYGVKDSVVSLSETTATAAANAATAELAETAYPKMQPQSEITTGDIGDVQLTLNFAGWYQTLDWVLTSRTSTTSTATTTQVGDLLQTSGAGIGATNAFLSTSRQNITASGINDVETIPIDTPYREKIEKLLGQGNSSGNRLAWGIYENRIMTIKEWAGATPSTITYRRNVGDGVVLDNAGGRVRPWNVRPDAMAETIELLDVAPGSATPDAAARFYVERVTCHVSGDRIGVTLEPAATNSVDARIARLSR